MMLWICSVVSLHTVILDLGYGCFKIPTILRTVNGTLLAMIEARKYSCDGHGFVDLMLRWSFDEGKTWAPAPSQLMAIGAALRPWALSCRCLVQR